MILSDVDGKRWIGERVVELWQVWSGRQIFARAKMQEARDTQDTENGRRKPVWAIYVYVLTLELNNLYRVSAEGVARSRIEARAVRRAGGKLCNA